MSGRFPLFPAALVDDPFCADDFCGEPFNPNLGLDLWVSRLISPVPYRVNTNQNPATGVTIDGSGFSYETWIYFSGATSAGEWIITKRAPTGEVIWTRRINGRLVGTYPGNDFGRILYLPASNRIVVAMQETSSLDPKELLVCLNTDGELLWAREYFMEDGGWTQGHLQALQYAQFTGELVLLSRDGETVYYTIINPSNGARITGYSIDYDTTLSAYTIRFVQLSNLSAVLMSGHGTSSPGTTNFFIKLSSGFAPIGTSAVRLSSPRFGCLIPFGSGFVAAGPVSVVRFDSNLSIVKQVALPASVRSESECLALVETANTIYTMSSASILDNSLFNNSYLEATFVFAISRDLDILENVGVSRLNLSGLIYTKGMNCMAEVANRAVYANGDGGLPYSNDVSVLGTRMLGQGAETTLPTGNRTALARGQGFLTSLAPISLTQLSINFVPVEFIPLSVKTPSIQETGYEITVQDVSDDFVWRLYSTDLL